MGGAMASVLSVRGVVVTTGDGPLLDGVSFELQAGERVALVGPSGCGKTTLMRVIAGLIDPSEGSVRLDGETPEVVGWPAFRRRVVYVSQTPILLDSTVRENLERPFEFGSSNSPFPEARANALLQRVGLAGQQDKKTRVLSIGERQRVCLVRALLVEPSCLLLDEPTSALDAVSRDMVEGLLVEFTEAGGCALVGTHDHEQAGRLCGRRIELSDLLPAAREVEHDG